MFTTLKATNQLSITDIISAHEYSLRTTRTRSRKREREEEKEHQEHEQEHERL